MNHNQLGKVAHYNLDKRRRIYSHTHSELKEKNINCQKKSFFVIKSIDNLARRIERDLPALVSLF